MGTCIATIDNGRLHVGYGDNNSTPNYLGNIGVYTNPITQFFTRLFGFSTSVNIDGTNYCVNKKSLNKHLRSIGIDSGNNIARINEIGYQKLIKQHENSLVPVSGRFGDGLSVKKRMKFFEQMIGELEVNNTEAVKRLIRKGAYVDRQFFRVDEPINYKSFWIDRNQLESLLAGCYIDIQLYSYTPFAFAVEKGNQPLIKFMSNIKKGDTSSDKKQTFHYQVTRKDEGGTYWTTKMVKEKCS